jgi:hypothetical protein
MMNNKGQLRILELEDHLSSKIIPIFCGGMHHSINVSIMPVWLTPR